MILKMYRFRSILRVKGIINAGQRIELGTYNSERIELLLLLTRDSSGPEHVQRPANAAEKIRPSFRRPGSDT